MNKTLKLSAVGFIYYRYIIRLVSKNISINIKMSGKMYLKDAAAYLNKAPNTLQK